MLVGCNGWLRAGFCGLFVPGAKRPGMSGSGKEYMTKGGGRNPGRV